MENAEFYFPLDRETISLFYNSARTLNTDEKIVQKKVYHGKKAGQVLWANLRAPKGSPPQMGLLAEDIGDLLAPMVPCAHVGP